MKQYEIEIAGVPAAARTTEMALYPNIDSDYTIFPYTGERVIARTTQKAGIKRIGNMGSTNMQGMAIYGDIAVRMANVEQDQTKLHSVYRIVNDTFVNIATFTMATLHSNTLQFAPELLAGQTLPYLYVAGIGSPGRCFVLSFDANYQPTLVQTITAGGQVIIGDDGYIWASWSNADDTRKFRKYRKVAVSEGDITLTDADIVDEFNSTKVYGTGYTAQGWKVKFGKIWYVYGGGGANQYRGISVYETASHRLATQIDLTDVISGEFEDVDFYDNALLLAMINNLMYKIQF